MHDLRGRFFLNMRTSLRLLALFIALLTLALWFFGGLNTGWTKTTEMVKAIDPVTGLEAITWETRFLPGLDFLGAGLFGATVLCGASLLVRKPTPSDN